VAWGGRPRLPVRRASRPATGIRQPLEPAGAGDVPPTLKLRRAGRQDRQAWRPAATPGPLAAAGTTLPGPPTTAAAAGALHGLDGPLRDHSLATMLARPAAQRFGTAAILVLVLAAVWLPPASVSADWPLYRGPAGNGVSTERIRTNWTAAPPRLLWR